MVKDKLYRKELEYTAILNHNMMGTVFERREYPKFKRIIKLNEQNTPKIDFKKYIELEIIRYLADLNLSMRLKPFVYYNFSKYRAYFPKHSKQNKYKLLPVVIYITCLTSHIFITKKKIIECSGFTRKSFHTTLKLVLEYDKELQCLIASDEFRIRYILNIFNGISIYFNFPPDAMHKAFNIFPDFFIKYRTMSNTNMIIGLYLIIAHTYKDLIVIRGKRISDFLGVHSCMITRMKKLILKVVLNG